MPNLTPLELRVLRYLHDSEGKRWHTLSDVVEGLVVVAGLDPVVGPHGPGAAPYPAVRSSLRTLTAHGLAVRGPFARPSWACTTLGEAEVRRGGQLRLVPERGVA